MITGTSRKEAESAVLTKLPNEVFHVIQRVIIDLTFIPYDLDMRYVDHIKTYDFTELAEKREKDYEHSSQDKCLAIASKYLV